jgi:hypothetical protein
LAETDQLRRWGNFLKENVLRALLLQDTVCESALFGASVHDGAGGVIAISAGWIVLSSDTAPSLLLAMLILGFGVVRQSASSSSPCSRNRTLMD